MGWGPTSLTLNTSLATLTSAPQTLFCQIAALVSISTSILHRWQEPHSDEPDNLILMSPMNLFWWAPLICQIVAIVYLLASNLCWTSFWRARRTYFIQSRWWIWFRWARPHFWPTLMSDALVSISTSIMYTMHPFDKRNLILTSPTNLILWWARRTSFWWAPLICQIAAIVYLLASNRWWTSFWRARSNLILTSPTNLFIQSRWWIWFWWARPHFDQLFCQTPSYLLA